MTAAHFSLLLRAEWSKLSSRTMARLGVVFAILIGLGVPIAWALGAMMFQQAAPDKPVQIDPTDAIKGALFIRNYLLLMRVFLVTVTAMSVAAEFQSRTLREDLIRAVPRWSVLLAKWTALCVWIAVTTAATGISATVVSSAVWGVVSPHWGETLLGYIASFGGDCGLAALTVAVAVATRSLAGTITGVILYYFMDYATWVGLWLTVNVPMFGDVPPAVKEAASQAMPLLPSAAFNVWLGMGDTTPWSIQSFVALLAVTLLSLVAAVRLFDRVDVP